MANREKTRNLPKLHRQVLTTTHPKIALSLHLVWLSQEIPKKGATDATLSTFDMKRSICAKISLCHDKVAQKKGPNTVTQDASFRCRLSRIRVSCAPVYRSSRLCLALVTWCMQVVTSIQCLCLGSTTLLSRYCPKHLHLNHFWWQDTAAPTILI